jgi:hypothetical protein
MNRTIKSLLTLLLVLLLIIGVSFIPLPSEAGNSLASARGNTEMVNGVDANQ